MFPGSSSPNKLAARYLENITNQTNSGNNDNATLKNSSESEVKSIAGAKQASILAEGSKRKSESPLSSPRRNKSVKHTGQEDSNTPKLKKAIQENVLRSPVEIFADKDNNGTGLYSRNRLRKFDSKQAVTKLPDVVDGASNKENNNANEHFLENLTPVQRLQLNFQNKNKKPNSGDTSPIRSSPSSPNRKEADDAQTDKGTGLNHQNNILGELQGFHEKGKLNQASLKKTNSVISSRSPKGNKGYEFLCRIAEIKEWIEECIGEEVPSALELSKNGLKDGVILAKLTKHFVPELVKKIIPSNSRGTVEYRHTENIVHFFYFLDYIDMPDLFRFELTDLYEGKNIPKVIFCLYALCNMLSQQEDTPTLKSLVGKLEFEESDIKCNEGKLKEASVPDFGSFEPLMRSLELEQRFFGKKQGNLAREAETESQNHHHYQPGKPHSSTEFYSNMVDESPLSLYTQLRVEESELNVIQEDNEEEEEEGGNSNQAIEVDENSKSRIISVPEPIEEDDGEDNNHVHFTQSTLRRVDSIKKPTYNDFSLVEIEDTTIIQEHATEQMDDDSLDNILRNIIKVQSLGRGFIARYQIFVKRTMLKMFSVDIVALQSIARRKLFIKTKAGRNLRKKKINGNFIVYLQAVTRGSLARQEIMTTLRAIKKEKAKLIEFQSVIRGEISRFYFDSDLLELEENEPFVAEFQAIVKGALVRSDMAVKSRGIIRSRSQVTKLQCIIRGNRVRKALYRNTDLDEISDCIVSLQSIIRTQLYQNKLYRVSSFFHKRGNQGAVVELQSVIRGQYARKKYQDIYYQIYKARDQILELQMIARGGLARCRLSKIVMGLDYNEMAFENINAIIRASVLRKKFTKLKYKLHRHGDSVAMLQGVIRGVLMRFKMELFLDDLLEYEPTISALQAKIKSILVQKHLNGIMSHYMRNIDKVIKVQSRIRAHNQNDAYRKLIAMKDPSLAVVRQFAFLLNDTTKDIDEEVKLENLNHQIMAKTKENNELEKHCNELDAKIALLVKNKITLDELIHQSNSKKNTKQLDFEFKKKLKSDDVFSASHKSKSERFEVFESLIYILQTCPEYFIRLFRVYNNNYTLKGEIEKMALICFDYGGTKNHFADGQEVSSANANGGYGHRPATANSATYSLRDEFLFINLIIHAIQDHVNSLENLDDFRLSQTVVSWQKLLTYFNKSDIQRKIAKKIFGSLITSITEIDNFSLESNPMKIYRQCIAAEEMETGRKSAKPRDVPVEIAIKDPVAREQFIKNLNLLRELTIRVLTTLEENVDSLPVHIKAICYHTYFFAIKHFLGDEEKATSLALTVLVENYLNPIISSPENYNISLITFSTKESLSLKTNLSYICKVLSQIATLKEFPLNQVYYQPLNEFVQASVPSMKRIIKKVVEVGDIESVYNINCYHDLTARVKPSLIIKNVELLSLKSFIQEFIGDMAPSKNDPIYEYVKQLDKAKNLNISDQDIKDVKLTLNPSIKNFSGIKTNTLLLDAKRCMLYIMQIQSSKKNLLELLLSKITDADETKYQRMLRKEQENSQINKQKIASSNSMKDLMDIDETEKNEFSKSNFFKHVSSMSYHELKSHTLEVVLELESIGKLSRENRFQSLLNEIAFDIKTKHDQRMARSKEINLASQTLDSLFEKEKYLKALWETYNNYIKKSIATLQETSNNRKHKKYLPFSKQYFYQRALRKKGKQSKFGTYKHSCKYLYERKILLEINGVKNLDLLKVDFIFSCDEVGVFMIELKGGLIEENLNSANAKHNTHTTANGNNRFTKASAMKLVSDKKDSGTDLDNDAFMITGPGNQLRQSQRNENAAFCLKLDDLLQCQYEGIPVLEIYNGMVKFDTINLLTFIFKKFYDTHNGAASMNGSAGDNGESGGFGSSVMSTKSNNGNKGFGFLLRKN